MRVEDAFPQIARNAIKPSPQQGKRGRSLSRRDHTFESFFGLSARAVINAAEQTRKLA